MGHVTVLVVVWTVPSSRDLEWGGPVVLSFGAGAFWLASEWTPVSHSHFTVLEFAFWCGGEGLHGEGEPQRVEKRRKRMSFLSPIKHKRMEKYF